MKSKIHTRYKNSKGGSVPGATTILGILNKPALVPWAWKLGTEGVDFRKFTEDKAEVGTLAHYLILCHLKAQEPDLSDYSQNQIDQAENAFLSFLEWEKSHPIEPILIETPLVSEVYQYGGTLDLLAKVNGSSWLIDFKTGKGIYPEMLYQLAAYRWLVREAGYGVDNARILRIGRDETEGFEERAVSNLDDEFQVFLHCLNIYSLQKKLKKKGK